MLEIVVTAAAFDVAAGDVGDRRVDALIESTNVLLGTQIVLNCWVESKGLSQLMRVGVDEVTRRRDLRIRVVVHEHRFEVRLGTRRDLIFGERAERVALVRTLVVIVRARS